MTRTSRLVRATLLPLLAAHPATAAPITKPRWVAHTRVTEYVPVPERWFVGAWVEAPGLDGRRYHLDEVGAGGWINATGKRTRAGRDGWSGGAPFWRSVGYRRNRAGRPTFPLEAGGWLDGRGRTYRRVDDVTVAPGRSRPLTYSSSVAVDPTPLGSRVYVPANRTLTRSRGWFTAADTGGAIKGRHRDVFRPPPGSMSDPGRSFEDERALVIPPVAAR